MTNGSISKACTGCKEVQPLSEFHKAANSKDGHRWACKSCCKVSERAYKVKNAVAESKRGKIYRSKHVEDIRIRDKAYRELKQAELDGRAQI